MSENKHYKAAAALLADEPSQYEIESSKALATLALAYEQRTANLIALWSNPQSTALNSHSTWGVDSDGLGRMLQEIQRRLGAPE